MEVEEDPKRPTGRQPRAPSRHDWAGPASVITLFNCIGCSFTLAEGSADPETVDAEEEILISAPFNMQPIGKVNAAMPGKTSFAGRVEWNNEWLPWKTQEIDAGGDPPSPRLSARSFALVADSFDDAAASSSSVSLTASKTARR